MITGKHEQSHSTRRRQSGTRRPLGLAILVGLLVALICGGCDFGSAPVSPDALGTPIGMPPGPAAVDPAITVIVIHAAATATPEAMPPTPTVAPAASATLTSPAAV